MENPRRARFRELRSKLGVTQEQMARDLGLGLSQMRNIETGRSNPSPVLMFRIALYFGVTVEDVFPDLVQEARELQAV